jgi:hypothetical protein
MTTWTQIDTGAISTAYDFNPFAIFTFAQGCFADGSINETWTAINTVQTPNWTQISTGAISSGYEFDPYAVYAFGQGCFADGAIYDQWTIIPTVN